MTLVTSSSGCRGRAVVEQPNAVAEQERGDVDLDLVEQPGREVLLNDVSRRRRSETSLSPAAARACSSAASMPSVTNVNVVPPCFVTGSRAWWVRTNTGRVEGRVVAPPAVRVRVVLPRARAAAEHPPAHQIAPVLATDSSMTLGVGVRLAALHAVALAPAREPVRPTRGAARRPRRAAARASGSVRRRSRRATS